MKCHIPQISWHNRDPVLSIDCQKSENAERRIATAGTDTHVFIWLLHQPGKGVLNVEFVADLNRHTRTVNAVRFSPNGEILASGDDEACIILWKMQTRDEKDIFDDSDDGNKEHWVPLKILRGHIDDISDLCWSNDSLYLMSGSVDNSALLWDIQKGKNVGIISDHKGFVQGVAWDPVGQYYATLSSDRILRIFLQQNKKLLFKVQKTIVNSKETSEMYKILFSQLIGNSCKGDAFYNWGIPKSSRIFYDDTLKSFCRRLTFSPDGEILIVPSGIIEQEDGKFTNASYVFSRHALNRPIMCLPTNDQFTVAVRCCPILLNLKPEVNGSQSMEQDGRPLSDPVFNLPYRIIFAVATQNAILMYDTQHLMPIAHISNIHYTRLTDLAWSSDGHVLMASSTDGYCSFVVFGEEELGIPYIEKTSDVACEKESILTSTEVIEDCENDRKINKSCVGQSTKDSSPTKISSCDNESGVPLTSMDIMTKKCLTSANELNLSESVINLSLGPGNDSGTVLTDEPMVSVFKITQDDGPASSSKNFTHNQPNKKVSKPGRRIQLTTLKKATEK